jgi:hypothetical protein
MSTKQRLTQADARALVATGNGNDDGTASAVDDGIRRSAVDDDDNCDEEEMISLGLSVDSNSNEDGSSSVAVSLAGNNTNTNNNNSCTSSAMPATPAAAASTVMYSQQSYHQGDREHYAGYGGHNHNNPSMVRSVAHQARHRRTPGAGNSNGHNHKEVSRRYYYY